MSVYLEILLVILPYLTEVVTYTTPLYYTSVLKCNGGVARTQSTSGGVTHYDDMHGIHHF